MGESGVIFREEGEFKYAITEGRDRVTLHALPMYCNSAVHSRFKKLLKGTSFGKGCIRFKATSEVDLSHLAQFIQACADSRSPAKA